jgi:hypothetical protein
MLDTWLLQKSIAAVTWAAGVMWRFIVADDPQMIYESRCDNVASQVQCRMLQDRR